MTPAEVAELHAELRHYAVLISAARRTPNPDAKIHIPILEQGAAMTRAILDGTATRSQAIQARAAIRFGLGLLEATK